MSRPGLFAWVVLLMLAGRASTADIIARRPTVAASIRLPFTSNASPAMGDVNGDGRPEIAVTCDNIGDITRERNDPRNVNQVVVFGWRKGGFGIIPGWPRHTPDAALGVAMADINSDKRLDIVASCAQDIAPTAVRETGTWLVSRLYVWNGAGLPIPPWIPDDNRARRGLSYGHAYACPIIADFNADGREEILQGSQGEWQDGGFKHGGLRIYSLTGRLLSRTQTDYPTLPWYSESTPALDTPPVLADLNGDGRYAVVAAPYSGKLHAWTGDGRPLPGWLPSPKAVTQTSNGALLRAPIAAGDINGDGKDEIIAGAFDGALYCWDGAGRLLWKSGKPVRNGKSPALTTGAALGRLRRNSDEVNAVAGDATGGVTVWDSEGRIRWSRTTTPGFPVEAEPAIGDVNADGTQDVVIGGTDGYVYAYDGETGGLLWQMPTAGAPTQQGMRLEGVFGAPVLCDLRGNGRLNVVVATAQRYVADAPSRTWMGFGHIVVLDCGAGTYRSGYLDWPQYRNNCRRSGRLNIGKPRR